MKRKKKAPRGPRSKRHTVKAAKPKAKAPKARAKRAQKKLVKLARRKASHKARRAQPPARRPKSARHDHKKQRLTLVKRKLSNSDEGKINLLIARVYQKAAEEMRRAEQDSNDARQVVFSHAAQEIARMEALARKFEQ